MVQLGLLAVVIDYEGVALDEFVDWYEEEHLPERVEIPGFLTATRWMATNEGSYSLGLYDLDGLGVLNDAAYRAVSPDNRSPWTNRIIGQVSGTSRYVALQESPGDAVGPEDAGAVFLVRFDTKPDQQRGLAAWFEDEHLRRVTQVPGVLLARRFGTVGAADHGQLITYHLRSPEVMSEEAWRTLTDPDWSSMVGVGPWGQDCMVFERPAGR